MLVYIKTYIEKVFKIVRNYDIILLKSRQFGCEFNIMIAVVSLL